MNEFLCFKRAALKMVYYIQMKRFELTAVVWKEGKYYVSKCTELGVSSYGLNPEKAIKALGEAVELYLVNAEKLGFFEDMKPSIQSETRFTAPLHIQI